jgi:hypothetical protein
MQSVFPCKARDLSHDCCPTFDLCLRLFQVGEDFNSGLSLLPSPPAPQGEGEKTTFGRMYLRREAKVLQ